MKKLIIKFKEWKWKRDRFRSIEKAVGMRLRWRQRRVVLNPNYPDLSKWKRRTGKTTVACIWTLMWRVQSIDFDDERRKVKGHYAEGITEKRRAIPDPDGYESAKRLSFLINTFLRMKFMCMDAGVDVCNTYSRSGILGRSGSNR